MEGESKSADIEYDQNKINLIGTFYGGCGSSIMAKKNILKEIKRKLIETYSYNDSDIEINLANLKSENTNQFDIENLNINFVEFNIYLFYKNKKLFLGTSSQELKDYYYDGLAGGFGYDKKAFMEDFCKKIDEEIKKIK